MTSFLPDTHSKLVLKVLHRTLQHSLQQSCDFLTNGKFQLFDRAWSVRIHSRLEVTPQKKKSQIDRSGERGDQETSPKREITCWGNMRRTTSIDTVAVWAVAPSCWNHISLMFTPRFWSSGRRKLFNPLNAELNPICHLLALLGAHHILHLSRIRVNMSA